MTAPELWAEYSASTGSYTGGNCEYTDYALGDDPDGLAELVRTGVKTATSSAFPLYEVDHEALPKPGDFSIILDGSGEAVCIIRTTRVTVVPFKEVSANHAWLEGEGDRSLETWREIHRRFFTRSLREAGLTFDEDMPVVCEEIELVYPTNNDKESDYL